MNELNELNGKIENLKQLLIEKFSKKFFCNFLYQKLRSIQTEEFHKRFENEN